jgi:hypothetical protein
MVLGQPLGDIARRDSLAKPGRRLRVRLPHVGRKTDPPPNSEWPGPTIPPGWDDRQRQSNGYGDRDTHSNGNAAHHANAQAASDAGAETMILEFKIFLRTFFLKKVLTFFCVPD